MSKQYSTLLNGCCTNLSLFNSSVPQCFTYDIYIYIYQRKSAVQLTSVGLAHAHPNSVQNYTVQLMIFG